MAELVGDRVLYLYGVVPGGRPLADSPRAPLEAVPFGAFAAVVELVAPEALSPDARARRPFDAEVPLVRRHAAVLEDLMKEGPIIPARPGTLFPNAAALAGALERDARRFADALRWLGGRQEWGLALYVDEERLHQLIRAADPRACALEAAVRGAGPGQAQLLARQRDVRVAALASARLDEIVGEVLDQIAAVTADIRLWPLLSRAATARREQMILNAVVLVDITAPAALRAAIDRMAAQLGPEGAELELTGPWPPYSFCDDDSH
jgi:hypothetical protein